jgi:predicted dehydrogenase/glycosyltransferase involved in cell wall biosynthesis
MESPVSPSRPLSAAVLGCGPRGVEHAEALLQLEGVELAGVADLDEERRQAVSSRVRVSGYAGLRELLEGAAPELLVIATPPAGRVALVEEAAGSSVRGIVVEKPFALRLSEAERMAEVCEAGGVRLAVCHQLRFCPEFVELRRAVETGELGEVRLIQASAFGNLLDQGPHLIDAARWMAGDRPVLSVMSQRGDAAVAGLPAERRPPTGAAHPAPPWMTHHLTFEGGARAVVETGALYQRGASFADEWLQKRLTVVGTDGFGEAQSAGGGRIVSASGSRQLEGGVDSYMGATAALHAELRDALLGGAPHRTAARVAMDSLEAVIACAQSAVDGDAAQLPLDRGRDPVAELAGAPAPERRGRGAPRSAAPRADEPAISVILPLPDHRGYALDSVRSWLEQTAAAESYELLVMADGSEPELEQQVRGMLRPGDRMLAEEGAHEARLYDLGARAARAGLFLFTEPHCMAEPRALDEVMRFLATSDYDGACLRSVSVSTTAMARMEERFFDESFAEWSKEGHWCKVILRGFAVRREAYVAAGGFDHHYGRFSEFVLGARLHSQGRRIGYAAGAAVRHANATSLDHNRGAIVDFALGEAAFRHDHDRAFCERYFGPAPEARERHALDAPAARAASFTAFRNLSRRSVWREPAALRGAAATLVRYAPTATLGPRPRLWRARAEFAAARARCLLWRTREDRLFPAFADGWNRLGYLTRLEYEAAAVGEPRPIDRAERFAIDELPEERLLGFHQPETLDGSVFRWSRGLASVELPMAGARRIRLLTVPARPGDADLCQWAFLGDRRLPPNTVGLGPDGITIDLDAAGVRPQGEERLTFTCAPLSGRWAPLDDSRELGLPVRAIELDWHARTPN